MPISSTGITVFFITDNNVWSLTTTFTNMGTTQGSVSSPYLFNVFLNDPEIFLSMQMTQPLSHQCGKGAVIRQVV